MIRLSGAVAAVLAIASGGSAQAQSQGALSAPDDPHAIVPLSVSATLDSLAERCATHDEPVRFRGPGAVTCEVKMGLGERIAARVLLREPFARSPRAFLRFTAERDGPGFTRVGVSGSVEDEHPPSPRRIQSLAGPRFARYAQRLLEDLGGSPRPL